MKIRQCVYPMIVGGIIACGSGNNDSTSSATDISGKYPTECKPNIGKKISDTSIDGIKNFLDDTNNYCHWESETNIHSSPIHGMVKVYFDEQALKALKSKDKNFPPNSSIIKEIYSPNKSKIIGHAVMIKTSKGNTQNSWTWYENLPHFSEPIYGEGHSSCAGCHSSGSDYVRSSAP